MSDNLIQLKNFIKLYLKSTPVNKLNSMTDVNYKVFSLKKGLPVTLVRTSNLLKEIYPLKSLYPFFEKHEYFWMIPITCPSHKFIGFVIRGFREKEYRTIFDFGNIPPLFGWEDFREFKLNSPIVLCEGVKDAIYLKSIYPYTLALNTSNITSVNMEILSSVTDKIVLVYDNDYTGIRSCKVDRESLINKGIQCDFVVPTHKDCAEFIENTIGESEFISKLKRTLKNLGGNVGTN